MYPIEFNDVKKKFSKGEKVTALRDGIPKVIKSIFRPSKPANGDLKKEEFWAVNDVSFKVKKGEVLGIIGPNGAGKSTILKLLSKIMKPTSGEFKVNGRLSALIEVTAGFHPEFTGKENIYFNGSVLGMSKKEIDEKYDEIVEFSGVGDFIDTPVKRYSSGMTARLGFAVAAHVDPDVLLVDEVLSVGDMTFQAKCTQKMRELLDSGVTIIFISHNIPLVQNLCQRVILIDKGSIIQEGLPEDVIPFYENLMNERREAELKKRFSTNEAKQSTLHDFDAEIREVKVVDEQGNENESYDTNDKMKVDVSFFAKKRIDNPIFALEIVRSDGVRCCYSNTKDKKANISYIEGDGKISIDLDSTHLGSDIYFVKIAILSDDLVHPYSVAKRAVFKINAIRNISNVKCVYQLGMDWKTDNVT